MISPILDKRSSASAGFDAKTQHTKGADDRVNVIIEDDGCGFNVTAVTNNAAKQQRLGLLGMKEPVALVYVRIPTSL